MEHKIFNDFSPSMFLLKPEISEITAQTENSIIKK
jgi:hypothetical protein